MVKLTIDNMLATVDEGATILEAAESVGIAIPTLCYLKAINEVGACRVCVVEIEGDENLSAACNTVAEEGMVVLTNSRRVLDARRVNLELALAEHNGDCTTCVRSMNCSLQAMAREQNILDVPFAKSARPDRWPQEYPLIRDGSKCINCMRCLTLCEKVQSLGVWDLRGGASRLTVDVAGGKSIDQSDCALCGQCITHCPVGALRARDDTDKVFDAIYDPEVKVVVQIAPAVRSAWGEDLGLGRDEASVGRMVSAVRALGVDYVFDTDFSADLTIMEEGSELLERLQHSGDHKWPMFTSCCPGWLRFVKSQYPELVPNLSTAKSPQQMFGAVTKTWFAQRAELDPAKIFSVSIMPCVAKKHECALPVMDSAGYGPDVDVVLTSRELARMVKMRNIDASALDEGEFDSPLGESTGAAVIFGATGGVMEAALRSAYYLLTGKNPKPEAFSVVRGSFGWREATVSIEGTALRAAVASGLGNARELIEKIKSGEAEYDFVEIMACPGGCVGGGGQPIRDGDELAPERAPILYDLDEAAPIRFSHENPAVQKAYEEHFEKPLSHKSHALLHTDHNAWSMPR